MEDFLPVVSYHAHVAHQASLTIQGVFNQAGGFRRADGLIVTVSTVFRFVAGIGEIGAGVARMFSKPFDKALLHVVGVS